MKAQNRLHEPPLPRLNSSGNTRPCKSDNRKGISLPFGKVVNEMGMCKTPSTTASGKFSSGCGKPSTTQKKAQFIMYSGL